MLFSGHDAGMGETRKGAAGHCSEDGWMRRAVGSKGGAAGCVQIGRGRRDEWRRGTKGGQEAAKEVCWCGGDARVQAKLVDRWRGREERCG